MQTDVEPEIAEYPEAGPYWVGLWAVARHWVGLLEDVFAPDVLATTGVTRAFALRCCKWLWSIEGLIRRLIIAAAMKLSPAPLAANASRKPPSGAKAAAQVVSFTVLPRLPSSGPRRVKAKPRAPLPAHRHLVFPGDNLLALFPRHDRRNAPRASVRTHNPLERRGRISRWDPDYRGQNSSDSIMFRGHLLAPGATRSRDRTRADKRSRADRSSPYWKPNSGMPEWKRVELEWDRVIPAPRLAGRIRALMRVLAAPERWVERTARRLCADLVERLSTPPPPILRRPKLDRGPPPPILAELEQAHALIDTS